MEGRSLSSSPNTQKTTDLDKIPCFMIACCEKNIQQSSPKFRSPFGSNWVLTWVRGCPSKWPITFVSRNLPFSLPEKLESVSLSYKCWLVICSLSGGDPHSKILSLSCILSEASPTEKKKYCLWIVSEASVIFRHYLLPSKCFWEDLDLVKKIPCKFSQTRPD